MIKAFPLGGGYSVGLTVDWSPPFLVDAAKHAILPALSIVLADLGFWALGMRGMMVTVQGEDYMTLAEAKGLIPRRIFLRYGVRNAILPQITSLALSIGRVVSGAMLVEIVFGFPGVGTLLFQAIRSFDYFVIYGVVFMVIVAIGLATLILDLMLPVARPAHFATERDRPCSLWLDRLLIYRQLAIGCSSSWRWSCSAWSVPLFVNVNAPRSGSTCPT